MPLCDRRDENPSHLINFSLSNDDRSARSILNEFTPLRRESCVELLNPIGLISLVGRRGGASRSCWFTSAQHVSSAGNAARQACAVRGTQRRMRDTVIVRRDIGPLDRPGLDLLARPSADL